MNKYVEKCRELLHVDQIEDCLQFNNGKQILTMHEQLLNEISLNKKLQNSILNDVYSGDDSINLTKHLNEFKWSECFKNKYNDLRIFGGMFVDMILHVDNNNIKILNKTVVEKYGNEQNDEKLVDNKYYKTCSNLIHTKSLNKICECIGRNIWCEDIIQTKQSYENMILYNRNYFNKLSSKLIRSLSYPERVNLIKFDDNIIEIHDYIGDINKHKLCEWFRNKAINSNNKTINVYATHHSSKPLKRNYFGGGYFEGYYLCVNRKNDTHDVFLSAKNCETY